MTFLLKIDAQNATVVQSFGENHHNGVLLPRRSRLQLGKYHLYTEPSVTQ